MRDATPDIQEIFCGAIDQDSPEKLLEFLDTACRGDAELRAEVEKLLESHQAAGGFLKGSTHTNMSADTDGTVGSAAGSRTILHAETVLPDFLEPSQQPGSLGRLGPYEILEVVGRGGMGIVLKAQDTKLNRVVAVKVLAPELASNPTARRRFSREAQAAAAVSHDHVVTIYSVEDNEGNERLPYLVMELIDGRSLQSKIDREGHLELKEILRISRQIALGLAAAHEQGLIHRDVKPSNILLQNGVQRVKITDFGLARAVDDVGMTRTGEVTGTPEYMSPEQAQAQPVDARSDLFSLGSVLYAMCTGSSPFRANRSVASLRRVCDDTPRPIREINTDTPDWLVAIIDRLLEKNADNRFQTAEQVAELLGQHLAQLQDPGSTPLPTQHATMPGGRLRQRLFVVGLILLIAVSATIVWIVTGGRQDDDPWPADAPARAIAPFHADQARQYQQAWADYLGVPVQKEIVLGQDADGDDVILAMVFIPPGEFRMGSSDDEIARLREQATATRLKPRDLRWIDCEGPQHLVRITRPFYLGRHEFTTEQFRRFVSETGYETEAESSGEGAMRFNQGKMEKDPDHNWQFLGVPHAGDKPVVNVTWNDANRCCEWLSQQDAELTFALPTEAQWECACRAGTTTAWCCGDDESQVEDYGWVATTWLERVGKKRPNAFGLYDMHGNVWEWCRDSFYDYRDAGRVDPVGPVDGKTRIVRGGNCFGGRGDEWNNRSGSRSAARLEAKPDFRVFEHGFRVAAEIAFPMPSSSWETGVESSQPTTPE